MLLELLVAVIVAPTVLKGVAVTAIAVQETVKGLTEEPDAHDKWVEEHQRQFPHY